MKGAGSAPTYEIVDLRDRTAVAKRDLKSLKHTEMVVLSDDAFSNETVKRELRESSALLCLKSDKPAAEVLKKSVSPSQPLLIAIPNDFVGVRNLYWSSLDALSAQPIVDQMKRIRADLAPLDKRATYFSDSRPDRPYRDQFLDAFRAEKYRVITVVCHNDGGKIKFPDGTTVDLSEITAIAGKNGVLPIVLSCNTLDHIGPNYDGLVSTRALDFEDIASGLLEADRFFKEGSCRYVGDYLYAIDTGIKTGSESQRRLGIAIKSVGGGVAAICPIVMFQSRSEPTSTPNK